MVAEERNRASQLRVGDRCGTRVLLELVDTDGQGRPRFRTICDCGREQEVGAAALLRQRTGCVGCKTKSDPREMAEKYAIGSRFGNWEIVGWVPTSVIKDRHFNCRCTLCGDKWMVSLSNLASGASTRCRSCANMARSKYQLGVEVSGWMIVDIYRNRGKKKYVLECPQCGNEKTITGSASRTTRCRECHPARSVWDLPDGRRADVVAWENGISLSLLRGRVERLGWPLERAMTEPVHRQTRF